MMAAEKLTEKMMGLYKEAVRLAGESAKGGGQGHAYLRAESGEGKGRVVMEVSVLGPRAILAMSNWWRLLSIHEGCVWLRGIDEIRKRVSEMSGRMASADKGE